MDGINITAGIANAGSEELYYSLLGDFYLMIDMKIAKIQRCISENRIKDYTIEVHALKSASRLIGAEDLSNEFLELEYLGNGGNIGLIESETPAVLEHLRSYKEILKEYAKNAEDDKEDMNITLVTGMLQDMISAVDGFDLEKTDLIMKRLDNYRFPEDCLEELEKLRVFVADLAMDDIIASCKSIGEKLMK